MQDPSIQSGVRAVTVHLRFFTPAACCLVRMRRSKSGFWELEFEFCVGLGSQNVEGRLAPNLCSFRVYQIAIQLQGMPGVRFMMA